MKRTADPAARDAQYTLERQRPARRYRVSGIVQGVGFRPFVYRLAAARRIAGWVRNDDRGVEIHAEGEADDLLAFESALTSEAPAAARIASVHAQDVLPENPSHFEILSSPTRQVPITRVSPDLAVCADCLRELTDPHDRRFGYPYINCTNCGPRYSILLDLPYDRALTTMSGWTMCEDCRREYLDPRDRRFHAQPVACPQCGPGYRLTIGGTESNDADPVRAAARLLNEGKVVAIKGIGGYHLACDARNQAAVAALRDRKYRKERPFAVMLADVAGLRAMVHVSDGALRLARSEARPIVLAPRRAELAGVAPDNADLGVMLPYAPLHHLLFAAGAPDAIVMTSANRSSEPIAYEDDDAAAKLAGIADAILVGGRPIARRVDDSIVHDGPLGPVVVRRSRGYAPGAAAALPGSRPILAVGADLKNTVTVVVNGQAFVSQHLGDLEHYAALAAFEETISDLLRMYAIRQEDLIVAHDSHPSYSSTARASLLGARRIAVQHHRAHVASVLAERQALSTRVLGVAFDGTGFGDDQSIWGGEFFAGSVTAGLERIAHLRPAALPGGDAAARFPAQAAAGFVASMDGLPDLTGPPFGLPPQYVAARRLVATGVRTFMTTSVGRLFDVVAALLGFVRPMSFEGQAALWLEHLARTSTTTWEIPVDRSGSELDFRPALATVIDARRLGGAPSEIARAFHRGLGRATAALALSLADAHGAEAIVLSGGVFQNSLLLGEIAASLREAPQPVWLNRIVPPNDGGISLGQAAFAAVSSQVTP